MSSKFGHENISTTILHLPLIHLEHLLVIKNCAQSTCDLPLLGLSRNSVARIMTILIWPLLLIVKVTCQ